MTEQSLPEESIFVQALEIGPLYQITFEVFRPGFPGPRDSFGPNQTLDERDQSLVSFVQLGEHTSLQIR